MSPTAKHPNDVALAAYALGKLDAGKADTVRAHLEACETCRLVAERTPADTFVRRLREAGRAKAETPAPSIARTGVQPSPAAVVTNVQPPLPAVDDETPPALLNHPVLKVEKLLGRGGMGAVYLAHHAMLDKPVAVKVMATELVADEKSVARFRAEIRAVAKLDHPNIVRALDAQPAGGLHLFVMEYVDGQRLDEVVAARGRLPVDYACKCARLAALGLQHAHERGLAHRDFKPQNLMLSKTGQVKILDFGLAKLAASSASRGGVTSQGVILGTPEYMAPEQARDTATAGPPADVYALGATLFYLLTGQPPFTGTTAIDIVVKQLNDVPPRVTDLRPDVPAGLADLIARMLAKDAADRPPSAKDVAEALGPYTKKAAMSARAPAADANPLTFDALPALTTSLRKPSTRRRWPWMAGVAAALCGIALAVAAIVFSVKTSDGTIVVTVNEPDAEVFVDGERITVTRKGDEPIEIRKPPGKHTLEVKKGGFTVESKEVTLTAGGRKPVAVRLVEAKDINGQGVRPEAADTVTFVSTLPVARSRTHQGWFATDGTVIGKTFRSAFKVRGEPSPHGIFLHPHNSTYAEVEYNLDSKYETFRCGVAVPLMGDEYAGLGSAQVFQVFGDDKQLWRAKPVVNFDDPQWCEVSVAGIRRLCLRVISEGKSTFARTVWIEPRLIRKSETNNLPGTTAAPSLPADTEPKREAGGVMQPMLNRELLRNPGCEEPLQNCAISEWTTVRGQWWQRHTTVSPRNGNAYFHPADSSGAELSQDVDVSGFAADIDAGRQTFQFVGYIQCAKQNIPDMARVILEYRDTPSGAILAQFDTGEVVHMKSWYEISDRRVAPARTRLIRVRLISSRSHATTNDACYDDLSLMALTAPTSK